MSGKNNVGNPTCGGDVWAPKELSLFSLYVSGAIGLIAVLDNSIIIAAVIKDPLKRLRTPFNYFLINLAVVDLILGSVIMPLVVYMQYEESIGELTPQLNNVTRMTYFTVGMASLLCLIVLSIDRCIAKRMQ